MAALFETSEVARILGTNELRVNKLVGRFRLKPSEGGGKRGKRLRFSVQDVCRVGLAFWLFRGGLRALVIHKVLADSKIRGLIKNLNSLKGIREEAQRPARFLVIRPARKAGKWDVVLTEEFKGLCDKQSCLVIPLGQELGRLAERLEEFVI